MGMRPFRPAVNLHSQQPNYSTRTKTDHMAESTRGIAQELVQRVAQMTDNALSVDTRWFYYYKRRSVGRRCSCILGDQSSASATCGVCYGTGIVGGYDKYGTATEVFDSTYPDLSLINVTTLPEPRPSALILDPEATTGVAQVRIRLRRNAGYIDNVHASHKGDVQLLARGAGQTLWVPVTSANLTTMLGLEYVDVKVVMHRTSTTAESPIFLKLFLRYGLLPKDEIKLPGDIPPNTESISLQEYGFDEQFGTVTVVMGSAGVNRSTRITTFTHEDFLYYIERDRHWKITEAKPNYALGVFTSFDLTARWVQSFEVYKKFPI